MAASFNGARTNRQRFVRILSRLRRWQVENFSYSIIGTFGAGKTQLLYHLHDIALKNGLLPLFFNAEDLFRVILTGDNVVTPGDLFVIIKSKIGELKEAISAGDRIRVRAILDPRGKIAQDNPELLNAVERFYGSDLGNVRTVLLVDELEGQYGFLQDRVKTMDRSPLREWLEDKGSLKFLAFAPAGIYGLGGADRDRLVRVVLPSAEVDYIRQKLESDPGKSNSCWWLSRGKARQLFKVHDSLRQRALGNDAAEISRFLKYQLDSIGQPPTEVPAAVTDKISPTKIPFLINLQPIKADRAIRYVINSSRLDTGSLAERLVEAFAIDKDNALLISDYFKRTVKTLSDKEWITYVGSNELSDLFSLVFDHLLEYEHGSPQVSSTLGDVLNLYERVQKEIPALYGSVGTLWERKETDFQLPLSIAEVRHAFPFPSMNPIVKNFIPEEMKAKWEGRGLPLWEWKNGNAKVAFFISERDFQTYTQKDSFLLDTLPENMALLCTFPAGHGPKEEGPFLKWLKENGKLEYAELPTLLADFLMSAAGEIQESIPADFQRTIDTLKQDKGDVLLSRKAEIYAEAIGEIVAASSQHPVRFFQNPLRDAETIWGRGQIDRDIATVGISLAFADLTTGQREILAKARDLFRSGTDGRGTGDLNKLMPRGGYIALADDLLPRYGRKEEVKDSEPIGRLSTYWRGDEKSALMGLATTLALADFLKIGPDENMSRVLEALWKTVREDFGNLDAEAMKLRLDSDISSVLEDCATLEAMLRKDFGGSGINFGSRETFVKSKQGVAILSNALKDSLPVSGTNPKLVRYILSMYTEALLETVSKDARELATLATSTNRAMRDLLAESESLRKNLFEYRRAAKFAGVGSNEIEKTIREQTTISRILSLADLQETLRERREHLSKISLSLEQLEKRLVGLEGLLKA